MLALKCRIANLYSQKIELLKVRKSFFFSVFKWKLWADDGLFYFLFFGFETFYYKMQGIGRD